MEIDIEEDAGVAAEDGATVGGTSTSAAAVATAELGEEERSREDNFEADKLRILQGAGGAFEDVKNKRTTSEEEFLQLLDESLEYITTAKEQLMEQFQGRENVPTSVALEPFKAVLERVKRTSDLLSNSYQTYFSSLVKLGKAVDKHFIEDILAASREWDLEELHLDEILAEHFFRSGMFDIGDLLVNEADLEMEPDFKAPFEDMHYILDELRKQNLEPAIAWCAEKRGELGKSKLEFELHKLGFLRELEENGLTSAIQYARKNFTPFGERNFAEIKRLMGSLLFLGRNKEHYSDLNSHTAWADISDHFAREYCRIIGFSEVSPLYTCVVAGYVALPQLLRMAKFVSLYEDWKNDTHLPVEIDFESRNFHFHSIFTCPVSKEIATSDNPPMILPCGHVFCKDTVMKISRTSSRGVRTRRFKCPTCPQECTLDDCKIVQF